MKSKKAGFTLVELLVSIVIAMFLLGGVMTIVQDTRRATSSQTQSTQLQDSVRLAMTMLTDVIQAAGYYSDPLNSNGNVSLIPSRCATSATTRGPPTCSSNRTDAVLIDCANASSSVTSPK